jgi:hypothetical protein
LRPFQPIGAQQRTSNNCSRRAHINLARQLIFYTPPAAERKSKTLPQLINDSSDEMSRFGTVKTKHISCVHKEVNILVANVMFIHAWLHLILFN